MEGNRGLDDAKMNVAAAFFGATSDFGYETVCYIVNTRSEYQCTCTYSLSARCCACYLCDVDGVWLKAVVSGLWGLWKTCRCVVHKS